jgi:hypothetical protein
MKFVVHEPLVAYGVIKLVAATYLGGYKIELRFADGKVRSIDFADFLNNAQHPEIRKFLDQKLFSEFKIIDGNLNWLDYSLIFPVVDLYDGII